MISKSRVAFFTQGCKLNFSETSTISRKFDENYFTKVDFNEIADVYVINTCSVTQNADNECKRIVRSALKKSPNAFIVVIGCYAQLKPEEISEIDGVDLILGASEKFKLNEYLHDISKNIQTEIHSCEINEVNSFENAYSLGDRTRAFLKVQDGCDYKCSYCTIPQARGISRSDKLDNIIQNANTILDKGIKEIVLTGVNIGDYGKGESGNKKHNHTFLDLIKEIDNIKHDKRIRISSIEPNLLNNEIIDFVAKSESFVPHFHIPLQSGSDKILKKMKRRYLKKDYENRVNKIKKIMPHCCIGVDVIVGFPGETNEDFIETYNFLNHLNISYLHVFTYSERNNTLAAKMKGAVPKNIRNKRSKMLRILSAKKRRNFYEGEIGSKRNVLFENENKNGFMFGFTENYLKVKTKYDQNKINKINPCSLNKIDGDGLFIYEKN